MIPLFVPSKNRAPQLRLMLESLNRNMPGVFMPNILWNADHSYEDAYKKLMKEELGRNVIWHRESNFVNDFYNFLNGCGKYVAFMMDDCIVYRKTEFKEEHLLACLEQTITLGDITIPQFTWCVSLRLGLNTIVHDYIHYLQQSPINPLLMDDKDNPTFLWYNFREHPAHLNYGFAFSWDGIIYRTADLLSLFGNDQFDKTENRNSIITQKIENFMCHKRGQIPYDIMCCPVESCIACTQWNDTHNMGHPGQVFGQSLESLNGLYMNDYVIDLDSMDFSKVQSCHFEPSFVCRKL